MALDQTRHMYLKQNYNVIYFRRISPTFFLESATIPDYFGEKSHTLYAAILFKVLVPSLHY